MSTGVGTLVKPQWARTIPTITLGEIAMPQHEEVSGEHRCPIRERGPSAINECGDCSHPSEDASGNWIDYGAARHGPSSEKQCLTQSKRWLLNLRATSATTSTTTHARSSNAWPHTPDGPKPLSHCSALSKSIQTPTWALLDRSWPPFSREKNENLSYDCLRVKNLVIKKNGLWEH